MKSWLLSYDFKLAPAPLPTQVMTLESNDVLCGMGHGGSLWLQNSSSTQKTMDTTQKAIISVDKSSYKQKNIEKNKDHYFI